MMDTQHKRTVMMLMMDNGSDDHPSYAFFWFITRYFIKTLNKGSYLRWFVSVIVNNVVST